MPLLPLFKPRRRAAENARQKNHIAFLHSLQSIMVLPDVNDYKVMDCAGACEASPPSAAEYEPQSIRSSGGSTGLVGKRNQLTGKSRPKDPEDPRSTQVEAV